MMTSLQLRIATLAELYANLITQLSELDQLRERVGEAQLAARKSRKEKRPRVPGKFELGREQAISLR
jgi:hypothetical protein